MYKNMMKKNSLQDMKKIEDYMGTFSIRQGHNFFSL